MRYRFKKRIVAHRLVQFRNQTSLFAIVPPPVRAAWISYGPSAYNTLANSIITACGGLKISVFLSESLLVPQTNILDIGPIYHHRSQSSLQL